MRLLPLALVASAVVAADPSKTPTPKFTLGTDTTVITEPLTADGYLDYETALNDRLRGKISPEANAAVGLFAALGPKPDGADLPNDFFKVLGIKRLTEKGDYFVTATRFFGDKLSDDEQSKLTGDDWELQSKPWKTTDASKWAEWLKVNEKPLAAVVDASKRKDYFLPLISRPKEGSPRLLMTADQPLTLGCQEVSKALAIRAMLRCGEEKFDDAWADILTVHRLARLIAHGATSVHVTVGRNLGGVAHTAEQGFIATAKLDAKTALKCQADLLALPEWPRYADKLSLGERYTALDALQGLRRYGVQAVDDQRAGKHTPEETEAAMSKLDWNAMFRLNTGVYDKLVAATGKPTRAARLDAGAKVDAELRTLRQKVNTGNIEKAVEQAVGGKSEKVSAAVSEQVATVFLGYVLTAVKQVNDSADRAEQISRHGVLAFALAAYRADHKKYPTTLADLVPKYLKAVPEDVFSGNPPIYEPEAYGYRLYSVGVNGKDDDGRWITDEPTGDDLLLQVPKK